MLWSTLMGSLPQHSVIEFRRYLNRFVYLFPDLSTMAHVLRSQFNQHEAFVEPLVAWLEKTKVNFVKGAFVTDIGFAESPGGMTANRLDYRRNGVETSDRRRARRHRAGDDGIAGRRPFRGNDGHAAPAASEPWAVMGVMEAPG